MYGSDHRTCGSYSRVLRLEMPSRNRGSGPGTHLGQHLSGLSRRQLTGNRISLKRNSEIRRPGLGLLPPKRKKEIPRGLKDPRKRKKEISFSLKLPFIRYMRFLLLLLLSLELGFFMIQATSTGNRNRAVKDNIYEMSQG